MLIQVLTQKPEMIVPILQHTPTWVWGLLAALLWLGTSQLVARTASLRRITVMPVAMTAFSLYGMYSAFSTSGQFASVIGVWVLCAVVVGAIGMTLAAPKGARFDAATQTFHLQGSVVPMLLILGIFLTKYAVGIELNMQPTLTHDSVFGLSIAAVYGAFSGIFTSRALRLLRVARSQQPSASTLSMSV